jgi:hypothetical protein
VEREGTVGNQGIAFEVRAGEKADWPQEQEGGKYDVVCLGCEHGWKRSFRVYRGVGVAKENVEYHVKANPGHRVRVTYIPPA